MRHAIAIAFGGLVALGCIGCDQPELASTQQAIIECNSETLGQLCDTDDTVCTREECQRVGADVVCVLLGNAPVGASCESDGDPCTLDSCAAGECNHAALPVGASCNDALFCTTGETCNAAGECTDGDDTCDDDNACTDNLCDETLNSCDNPPVAEGAPCDDREPCTMGTTCNAAGACTNGAPVDCSDGNACTDDACTPGVGCVRAPLSENTACDDGAFCTTADRCDGAGGCTGAPTCDDDNSCTDDDCDELGQTCTNAPLSDVPCDDQNDCTSGDVCSPAGSCTGTPVSDGTPCDEFGGCEASGTCAAGACTGTTTAPDGTPCNDDSVCTTGETCISGMCAGANIPCDDSDACTANSCDSEDGCVFFPLPACGIGDAGPQGPDAGRVQNDAGVQTDATPPGFNGELGGGGCACDAAGGGAGTSWPLFVAFAALLLWRRRTVAVIAAGVGLCLAPAHARADGFDAELYKPAVSSTSYFTQDRAQTLGAGVLNVGLTLNLSDDVLVLRDPDTQDVFADGEVVSRRLGMHLSAGFGVLGFLELGAELPFAISQDGSVDLLRPGESLSSSAIGDLRLASKARLVQSGRLSLAGIVSLSLPTGDSDGFFGSETVSLAPKLVVSVDGSRVSASLNAGYRVRGAEQPIARLTVDDEVFGGVGVSVAAVPRRFWLIGEAHLAVGVQADGDDIERPAESLFGGRFAIADTWLVQGGVGFGLGHGYGTPAFRGVLALAYAPQPRAQRLEVVVPPPVIVQKEPEPPPAPADSDGDGYLDPVDGCPNEPEDFDQFEDEDGCPDPDNDGDKIVDVDDKCPLEPEVVNGVDDEDGCPDEGVIEVIENRIVLDERVLFDTNRARVKRAGRKVLKVIAKVWKEHPEWERMVIQGHTDHRGPDDYNLRLSRERARRVRDVLIQYGVPAEQLEHEGYGRSRPLVEGRGEEALQRNRRVEFLIIDRTTAPAEP